MMKGTIALEGLEFFAFHGVQAEERAIGNRFTVDIQVETDISKAAEQDDLLGTVDYGELYTVVQRIMAQPAKLLEFLVGQISAEVLQNFPVVQQVTVAVAKANPPVGGVARQSKVSLTQTRD